MGKDIRKKQDGVSPKEQELAEAIPVAMPSSDYKPLPRFRSGCANC